MLNQGPAASAVQFLASGSKANTAAATGSWIDVSRFKGDLVFVVNVGTITAGTITPALEDADNDAGDNAAAVTPFDGAFSALGTADDPAIVKVCVKASAVRSHMRFIGTIVTGPVDVGVSMIAHPGHVGQ